MEDIKYKILIESIEDNFDNIQIIIDVIKGKINRKLGLSVAPSYISCGVKQLYSLPENATFSSLEDYFEISKKELDEFFTKIFKEVINNIKFYDEDDNFGGSAFILVSNTVFDYNSRINSILDSICHQSSEVRNNPNSLNSIKVWII